MSSTTPTFLETARKAVVAVGAVAVAYAGVALDDGQLRLKRQSSPKLDPATFALHMVGLAPKIVFERTATA